MSRPSGGFCGIVQFKFRVIWYNVDHLSVRLTWVDIAVEIMTGVSSVTRLSLIQIMARTYSRPRIILIT